MISRREMMKGGAGALALTVWPTGTRADAHQAAWTGGPVLPVPLQEIYATWHQGEIWIAGGLTPLPGAIGISDRSFALNPETMVWRKGPRLSEPIHHPQVVSAGGNLYVMGGFRAADGGLWAMRDAVDMLDGETWTPVPDMPIPLAETHAAVLHGRVHLAGGRTPAGPSNAEWQDHADTDAHLIFDPADGSWREGPPLPIARNSGAAASDGARLFVIGGRTLSGGNLADVHRFDTATNEWTKLPTMPEARGGTAAALLEDQIFLFGGEEFSADGGRVFENVMALSLTDAEWRELEPMPTPRHGLAAVAGNRRIWTIGGAVRVGADGTSAAVEILSPLFSLQLGRI